MARARATATANSSANQRSTELPATNHTDIALKATKDAIRRVRDMSYDNAEDYLVRAQEAANSFDNEGRKEGMRQFLDDKTYRPGLGAYKR